MSTIRSFGIVCSAVAALAVAACGGGGGGGGSAPGGGGGGGLVPTPGTTPSVTNASGTVVNDANGAPLAGIKVALRPWIACATPTPTSVVCPTPMPAPQTTTAADGSFSLANAPNGHYMLVIGYDVPGDATMTTVHDQITLSGGAQSLRGPVLPPVPTVTPPAWETNGSYRIATVDSGTEAPCFNEFNIKRQANALPQVVADEWLMENIRDITKFVESGSYYAAPWPGNPNGSLADVIGGIAGGTACAQMVDATFVPGNVALDSRVIWYGGYYNGIAGRQQSPIDPVTLSAGTVPWP